MTRNPLEVVKTLPDGFVKGAVAEVLEWRSTGLLPDVCRLREIAKEFAGDDAEDEYALRRAEEAVMTVAASRWAGL